MSSQAGSPIKISRVCGDFFSHKYLENTLKVVGIDIAKSVFRMDD